MRIAVLADTHIPKRAKTLPDSAWKILQSADAILHAGDVLTNNFLNQLSQLAPLYAVRGNNDTDLTNLPETLEFNLEGTRFAMIHDSGPKKQRGERLRQRFPDADVVVFGHSHIPINQYESNLLLFNPGSPTDRRTQPQLTMGLLEVSKGKIQKAEIIAVAKTNV
ncbi:MAG: metallophosphoesterase family protein [Candidatus Melainabacteria bacterium]|nr:metallophosphoesterase family protein [Candidatus Melainabacteria bacterium]